jgi:trans-aconitate 2-methyltransferase
MKDHYTFGDNDDAADRLALLARAFGPSSEAFLARVRDAASWAARSLRAVDLGCGPGFTTELLHRAVLADETWGLDASERLVARARTEVGAAHDRGTTQGLMFAVHDVNRAPFPVASVDVFYARYLFTHVVSPHEVLEACAKAGAAGALLAIEDNCSLESADPLFTDYYRRVETMHSHYGQNMWVGERLPAIASGSSWAMHRFDRTPIELDGRVMARLHAINVRTWRNDPFAASAFDAGEIDTIARSLDEVARGDRAAPPVTCTMAQAILRLDQRPSR